MLDNIRTFSAILDDLHFAVDWLRNRNCQINPNSRAEQYLRDVGELEKTWQRDGGNSVVAEKGHARLLNSLMEADAISGVTRLIAGMASPDPSTERKLCESLAGPMLPEGESAASGSNHPRNLFFELRLMAWILKAGLAAISGEEPDIRTELDGVAILIECKRLFSKASVEQRILKARRQLRNARTGDDRAISIIALDLTRVARSDGAYVRYANRDEFNRWVAAKRIIVTHEVEDEIRKAYKRAIDDRAEGIIEYFDAPTFNVTTDRWGTGFSLDCIPLRPGDHSIFRKIEGCPGASCRTPSIIATCSRRVAVQRLAAGKRWESNLVALPWRSRRLPDWDIPAGPYPTGP